MPRDPALTASGLPPARPVPLHRFTTPTGVRLIVAPDPKAEIAAIQFWMEAGAADDPDGASGVAHLTEHLIVRATRGAVTSFAGTTTLDSIVLRGLSLPGEVEAAVRDGLAAFSGPFEPTAVHRERSVLVREAEGRRAKQRRGTLSDASPLLQAAFGPDHPYARAVIGEDLDRLAPEDVGRFVDRALHPRRLSVVIAGAVDVDAIGRLADDLRGPPPGPLPPRPRLAPAPCAGEALRIGSPRTTFVFPAPPARSPDAAVLALAARSLGLFEGTTHTLGRAGLLVLRARGDARDVVDRALTAAAGAAPPERVAEARRMQEEPRVLEPESPELTAAALGHHESVGLGAEDWTGAYERVRDASSEELGAALKAALRGPAAVLVSDRDQGAARARRATALHALEALR